MIQANWRWSKDIEQEIVKEISGLYPVVHVCSGVSGLGDIRIDRWFPSLLDTKRKDKLTAAPNMCADMGWLPIKSGIAQAVISDPPYSLKRYYNSYLQYVGELARITAPGGKIIFLCPWVLQHPCLKPIRWWLRPSGDKSFSYKILSISSKVNGQIGDYK